MTVRYLEDLLPTVNFASRAITQTPVDWGIRIIPDCQIVYVVSGRAELCIGSATYAIGAGECVFYGPEQPYGLSASAGTEYYSIHFHWKSSSSMPVHPAFYIQQLDRNQLGESREAPKIAIPDCNEISLPPVMVVSGIELLFARIVKEYEMEKPGYTVVMRSLMMQALTLIVRQIADSRTSGTQRGRIDPAVHAMQEQPSRNWAVSELAALCGYHPIHFSKLFKEEIGLLPKQYIIAERIKLAKRALLQGEKLDALSERLGFTSIHYFSHQFKKTTGLTPTEFRMNGQPKEA
ncbi:AraC family transcriptional regulator [Cohnella soli]|uniref:AraC family transcriptional regulator n=1 Tax=Cohnella soli TaxID=425005 RepID=A0ABW0HZQ7_9BACL